MSGMMGRSGRNNRAGRKGKSNGKEMGDEKWKIKDRKKKREGQRGMVCRNGEREEGKTTS